MAKGTQIMRYVKKTCILRELKAGFSADGKQLSGIVKVEQYGANVGVELSTVNLASATQGEYSLLLADGKRRYKALPLSDGGRFSFYGDIEIAEGFYAILCFVAENAVPIAYGVCGAMPYDVFSLTRQAFSLPEPQKTVVNAHLPPSNPTSMPYDDELVANENYYEQETKKDDKTHPAQDCNDAPPESGDTHQEQAQRHDATKDADNASVRNAFRTDSDGYYQSVKGELTALFERYPEDQSLTDAYPASEWVRIKGEEDNPQELVGLIYESGQVKYICYALPATEDTPQEIRDQAYFVPVSPLTPKKGFFVIYQSAATGENIPKKEI